MVFIGCLQTTSALIRPHTVVVAKAWKMLRRCSFLWRVSKTPSLLFISL